MEKMYRVAPTMVNDVYKVQYNEGFGWEDDNTQGDREWCERHANDMMRAEMVNHIYRG